MASMSEKHITSEGVCWKHQDAFDVVGVSKGVGRWHSMVSVKSRRAFGAKGTEKTLAHNSIFSQTGVFLEANHML